MSIGEKIRRLRTMYGLTQEELADRTELTKGFISQLERDLTSPSIATLMDILECLGTDLPSFFSDMTDEKVVFTAEDTFEKADEETGITVRWLIPNSQKNSMEPIIVTLEPGAEKYVHEAHEGEEFGYVLSGSIYLLRGRDKQRVRKGESFSFKPGMQHGIVNAGKTLARVIWVATPPSF